MEFMYGIDPSNPRSRLDRAKAQRSAIWASFRYFLDQADSFVLDYWPPDEDVEPLLALGFEPQPTEVSPKAKCLQGRLTPELRKHLWGPGEGEVPWFKVALLRDAQLIYYVEEHEGTAGWNCTEETLPELYTAGVDPTVVINYVAQRRKSEARRPVLRGVEIVAFAAARVIVPNSTGYGYGATGEIDEVTNRERIFLDVGDGGKVWLEYDPDAMVRVDNQEAAALLLAQLHLPLLAGDSLRLELAGGVPSLTRTARGLGPWRGNFTHTLLQPHRTEWLTAVRLLGNQADRFVFCWTEEPAAMNGWRSDYGRERLLPFATDVGPTDFPIHARQMVGPVTPALLELITGEPPHGLVDVEGHGPVGTSGGLSPSPWWWLLLVAGQEIIFRSWANGSAIDLKLRPEEVPIPEPLGGRLHDLALARRRNETWLALARPLEKRVIGSRPATDFQFVNALGRQLEIRLGGKAIASVTVEPAALDVLLNHAHPADFLADAPSPAHLLVEKCGEKVRWRQLDMVPAIDKRGNQ